jgi:energy-coupling factor transport system ATP-binding protein
MGQDAAGQSIGQLARQVGFAFQSPELQIFNPTVREEIAFGPRNLGVESKVIHQRVEEALARFSLTALADYPPAALSLSARRLVALASIAAMHTPILVLDEPTVSLDPHGQAQVMSWLHERHREGTTILLITHDMELVASYAERVIVLTHGRWTADGTPTDVFHQSEVLREAGLEPPFAVQFAAELARPDLPADLTPEGAARGWLAHTAGAHTP